MPIRRCGSPSWRSKPPASAPPAAAAGFVKGGTLALARSAAQVSRLQTAAAENVRWDPDARWLSAAEAAAEVGATRVLGASFTPHCAAVDPARLVSGLAPAVLRRGVRIYEGTRALRVAPGRVETDHGSVRAEVVVRATEGFTPGLAGEHRTCCRCTTS